MNKRVNETVFLFQLLQLTLLVKQNSCTGLINSDIDQKAPITFKDIEGTNFRIYRRRFSWETAFIFCSRCVGNFATFENPDVATKVRDIIYSFSHFSEEYDYGQREEEYGLNRRYWFGLHDQKNKEGVWKWIKNTRESLQIVKEPLSYPWYTNQPDHNDDDSKNKREHCGGFWNPVYHLDSKPTRMEKHTFNDMQCDHRYYFICEKADNPPYFPNTEPEFCKVPTPEKFGRFMDSYNLRRNKTRD